MKLLFFVYHPGFVRHFTRALGLLCDEGHSVHLAFHNQKLSAEEFTQELRKDHPQVTFSVDAPRRKDEWTALAMRMRAIRDYGMYFDRRYAKAGRLRDFAANELKPADHARIDRLFRIPGLRRPLDWLLHLAELAVPSNPKIEAYIASHSPDVVLVTPLVMFNSPQVDVIKSARALGIPTGLCVASWDNLSNKGQMRELPDRVIVWNEAQVEEAVTLHGMSRRRIIVTGAQSFDQWFEMRPSQSREAFLSERGLDPTSDLILYLCSSTSISPDEIGFIRQWHDALRASSDPRVARAALLVRPHPVNQQPWEQLDALGLHNFAVWPRGSAGPTGDEGRRIYVDSIQHAAAVVGLNTSGQVEAGLMGRPVLTLLSKDLPHTLYGTTDTVHFQHLLHFAGGLLHVAGSFEEHIGHLSRAIEGDASMQARSRRFTEAFIRPRGMTRPAAPFLAEAIKEVATLQRRRQSLAERIAIPIMFSGLRRIIDRQAQHERERILEAKRLKRAEEAREAQEQRESVKAAKSLMRTQEAHRIQDERAEQYAQKGRDTRAAKATLKGEKTRKDFQEGA